jgi:hypothetical protein
MVCVYTPSHAPTVCLPTLEIPVDLLRAPSVNWCMDSFGEVGGCAAVVVESKPYTPPSPQPAPLPLPSRTTPWLLCASGRDRTLPAPGLSNTGCVAHSGFFSFAWHMCIAHSSLVGLGYGERSEQFMRVIPGLEPKGCDAVGFTEMHGGIVW